jgi:hypothetical protein
MPQQPELALEMKTPAPEVLSRLRASLMKATIGDAQLDQAIATAFNISLAPFTRSLTDGLSLLKAAIPDWQSYKLESYSDSEIGEDFYPESTEFQVDGPGHRSGPPHASPTERMTTAPPELAVVTGVVDYLVRLPAAQAKKAADAQNKVETPLNEPDEGEYTPLKEAKATRNRDARIDLDWSNYQDTAAGHANYYADWLHNMRETVLQYPDDNDDASTNAGVVLGYERSINVIRRQAKAIEIIQEMLEAEAAKSPSPRMKALKAAIEAIYTS